MDRSSSAARSFVEVVNNSVPKNVDASVMQGDAFEGLDFKQGLDFVLECLTKFGQNVNLDKFSARKPFFLVCSFGRACFRLDVHTVDIALQACFGGNAALYNVKFLRDRSFRFSVSSSSIGFQIYNLSSRVQSSFKVFFHLWGQGGPNWIAEERKFYKEQKEEWTEVKSKSSKDYSVFSRISYPQKVAELNPRISVFERLTYAQAASTVSSPRQHYDAIKGGFNDQVNGYSSGGQRNNHWSFNHPSELHVGANLLGFLSSFKFPNFPLLDWPDKTYLSRFKAHRPAPQIQLVSSFGEFSFFQSQVAESSSLIASSASPSLSLFSKNPLPRSATGLSATSSATMANIPIDPRPFVPHGFEIQHIAGRVGVKRVVVARMPRGFMNSTPSPPLLPSLKVRYTLVMFERC
jgi:hypothetical protein